MQLLSREKPETKAFEKNHHPEASLNEEHFISLCKADSVMFAVPHVVFLSYLNPQQFPRGKRRIIFYFINPNVCITQLFEVIIDLL